MNMRHRPRPRIVRRAQRKKKVSVNPVNLIVLLMLAFCMIVCMFFLWRYAAGAADRQEQRAIDWKYKYRQGE